MEYKNDNPWIGIGRLINQYRFPRLISQISLWIAEYTWIGLQSLWLYLCSRHRYAQLINKHARHHINKHKSTLSFLKALVINPKATGAILPSSKRLARIMASYITAPENTLIVELGAGTGVITEAILQQGISPERVVAVEYAPHLVKELQARFPKITVIEGNAAHLTKLLKNRTQPVGTIISSLPLRSLPNKMRGKILSEIPLVLSGLGQYIQFTYDITDYKSAYPDNYCLSQSTIVWRNIPPAKVGVYSIIGFVKI